MSTSIEEDISVAIDAPQTEPDTNEYESSDNDDKNNYNKSSDALSRGISTMLASVIRDFDSKAQDTLRSQHQLNSAMDRLTQELDQLLEDAPMPFIMQHAAKISGVRKRDSSLNTVLKSIQRRIDNIDRLLSVCGHHPSKELLLLWMEPRKDQLGLLTATFTRKD